MLKNKKILIGITGGIAAYKMVDYIRNLIKKGAEVKTVLTEAGAKFVSPLALETVTGNQCSIQMFPDETLYATHHIELADWADVMLIAPATADFIAKAAHGLGSDLLSTILLAVTAPKIIAPAMNVHMWENNIVQRNIRILQEEGFLICPPEKGELACGYSGAGRLAPYHHLEQYVRKGLENNNVLRGKKVLVTLGPTREFIDPVRFVSNYSSGKMGLELAVEAFCKGAEVTVIAGPNDLSRPVDIEWIDVINAEEMAAKVLERSEKYDYIIGAAAVADYTTATIEKKKIKKQKDEFALVLNPTTDIIKECGKRKKKGQKIIGFALESHDVIDNGKNKLKKKNLDAIIINSALQKDGGMGAEKNAVIMLDNKGNSLETETADKSIIAKQIWNFIV